MTEMTARKFLQKRKEWFYNELVDKIINNLCSENGENDFEVGENVYPHAFLLKHFNSNHVTGYKFYNTFKYECDFTLLPRLVVAKCELDSSSIKEALLNHDNDFTLFRLESILNTCESEMAIISTVSSYCKSRYLVPSLVVTIDWELSNIYKNNGSKLVASAWTMHAATLLRDGDPLIGKINHLLEQERKLNDMTFLVDTLRDEINNTKPAPKEECGIVIKYMNYEL